MTPNTAWERIRLANQALYNIGSKTILGSTSYDLLVDTIVKLSNFIYAHKDHVKEIEMNPVIVNEKNVIGLDALIINY